jgi:hypothetical protein
LEKEFFKNFVKDWQKTDKLIGGRSLGRVVKGLGMKVVEDVEEERIVVVAMRCKD